MKPQKQRLRLTIRRDEAGVRSRTRRMRRSFSMERRMSLKAGVAAWTTIPKDS